MKKSTFTTILLICLTTLSLTFAQGDQYDADIDRMNSWPVFVECSWWHISWICNCDETNDANGWNSDGTRKSEWEKMIRY